MFKTFKIPPVSPVPILTLALHLRSSLSERSERFQRSELVRRIISDRGSGGSGRYLKLKHLDMI